MTGEEAVALVQAQRDSTTPKLIASYTSARPGFWHVVEKGIEGRAWVVDLENQAVHEADPKQHPGGAIRAFTDRELE